MLHKLFDKKNTSWFFFWFKGKKLLSGKAVAVSKQCAASESFTRSYIMPT